MNHQDIKTQIGRAAARAHLDTAIVVGRGGRAAPIFANTSVAMFSSALSPASPRLRVVELGQTSRSALPEWVPVSTCTRRARCGAFTIIELLVVICMIAVLASLLLPAMAGVRPRGGVIQCLQNTRGIMSGVQMYASDWKDTLPNSGWSASVNSWAVAPGYPIFYSPIPTALTFDACLQAQLVYVRKSQLFPYIRTEKVLMCPMDKVNASFYMRGVLFSSYIWNGSVNGFGGGWNTLKISDSSLKASYIVQWENDETSRLAGAWNDVANWPNEGVSRRHRTGATVGLLDGSAKEMPLGDFYRMAGCNSDGTSGGGKSAAAANGFSPGPLWW